MPDTAILLCPYNHSQQLEGRVDGTSTYPKDPIQEEENHYKKGVKRDREVGRRPPNTPKALKEGSSGQAEDQPSQMNPTRHKLDRQEHRDNRCSYTKA